MMIAGCGAAPGDPNATYAICCVCWLSICRWPLLVTQFDGTSSANTSSVEVYTLETAGVAIGAGVRVGAGVGDGPRVPRGSGVGVQVGGRV